MSSYLIICHESGAVKSMSMFVGYEPTPAPMGFITTDESLYLAGQHDLTRLRGQVVAGQVVSVRVDPAWQPPGTSDGPLAELVAKVGKLPISEHSLRAEDQKVFLKAFAIPWVKAHPGASPEDAVAAIKQALRDEFPGDPLVVLIYEKDVTTGREDGLLMSYARSAVKIGAIPSATWTDLRALILGSTDAQLRQMLRKL